ncbi:MAG: PKD domain-containing protein [Solirubrobacterales bacterium]
MTIKLSDLGNNDINNRNYRLKSGSVSLDGHSLLQVMNAADAQSGEIDLATIPAVEIDRPRGRPIRISGDDVRDPGAFSDGPPMFYEDNGATVFVMPGSSGSAGSRFRFVGAPVGISVSGAAGYEVNLSASRKKIKVGQQVSFAATVTGRKASEQLTFRWNFNDGSVRTTSKENVTHTFRVDGAFAVVLTVKGPSGEAQDSVLIEVGKVPKANPKQEQDTNPQSQIPDGNSGTGGYGGGGGGYGSGFGNGYGTSGTGSGADPAPVSPSALPESEPEPDEASDGLVQVQGRLVDPLIGAPVVPSEAQTMESANPAPSGTEQGGFGVPGAALTLVGVGLLLGFGVFAELRVFSRLY